MAYTKAWHKQAKLFTWLAQKIRSRFKGAHDLFPGTVLLSVALSAHNITKMGADGTKLVFFPFQAGILEPHKMR